MATVERENIGLLNDKLIVKITKEDYLPAFDKKIKEYSKTASIPGFRKGMVPTGMIRKMYGPSIFSEEVLRTVEKQLYTYLNEEKPEIFAQPLPLDNNLGGLDMNNPSDIDFGFEIGLKPDFTIPSASGAPLTFHKVIVTDEMISTEIANMQIKAGKMMDQETIDNPENILNILFKLEGDDSNAGISKENSVLLKYFTPSAQQALNGKKTGDIVKLALNQAFESDKLEMMLQDLGFDKNDSEAASKVFELEIVKIGLVEKRELNEEFYAEVFPGKEIKTESELKEALKIEMEQYWDAQSRNQLHDQLYHFLLDQTKMEFPESFLKKWLQVGGEKQKTADQAEAEFPSFSNQLKWTLISDKLIQENKLDVSQEELREHMKLEVMRYFGQMNMGNDMEWLDGYIDRMMKDEKHVDTTYRRLITEKLFNWAAAQATPTEKLVSTEELVGMQHHHEH